MSKAAWVGVLVAGIVFVASIVGAVCFVQYGVENVPKAIQRAAIMRRADQIEQERERQYHENLEREKASSLHTR